MKKYEVTINNAWGVCDSSLFKKMASKGDIQSDRITDVVGNVVVIRGYAECHISTDEKEFNIYYYATDEGYFSSGSDYLFQTITDYLNDTDTFKIVKVKTKKGFTYKASPILGNEETADEE